MAMTAPDLVPVRTGVLDHPVLITTQTFGGELVESLACVTCAAIAGGLSQRPIAVSPGITCPICDASLCPTPVSS